MPCSDAVQSTWTCGINLSTGSAPLPQGKGPTTPPQTRSQAPSARFSSSDTPLVHWGGLISIRKPHGPPWLRQLVLGAPVGKNPLFPSYRMVADRSSPSRVRFAAPRPGPLRVDPRGWLFMRGKGGFGPWGARAGCQTYSTIKYVIVPIMKKSVALDRAPAIAPTTTRSEGFPAILRRAGSNACFAADEFFSAQLSNPHTRRAYGRAVGRFLAWCDAQGIELSQVTPGLAGRFIEEQPGEVVTKNQALAALRRFFDVLVTRHAVALNPFQSVRGRKHSVIDGQTPELTIQQARDLLASLDTSHVLGLRDRAVLGTLIYTGARVGAIAQLRLQDLRDQGRTSGTTILGKRR